MKKRKRKKSIDKLLFEHNVPYEKAEALIVKKLINKKKNKKTILKEWRIACYSAHRIKDYIKVVQSEQVNNYLKSLGPWIKIGPYRDKKSKKSFVRAGSQKDENRFKLFPIATVKRSIESTVKHPDYIDTYNTYFSSIKPFDEYKEIQTLYRSVTNEIRSDRFNHKFYSIWSIKIKEPIWEWYKIIR